MIEKPVRSEAPLVLTGIEHSFEGSDFRLAVERFELERGRVVVLTGPSGSGKSTLLAIACGALVPRAGSVAVAGQALDGLDEAARRRVRLGCTGQVLQDLSLLDYLGALENAVLPVRLAGGDLAAARTRARDLLDRLGIGPLAERRTHRLSGGERQRVALARGLAGRPSLVLADEPTGSLDPRGARVAAELLVAEARSTDAGLLFTTHDPGLTELADEHFELVPGEGGAMRLERSEP